MPRMKSKIETMFTHNLRIAFRNLRKYKTQNIISIIGLAVGFVCFAFSALWIRYEMSYDNFHENADRIYRVHTSLYKWNAQSGDPEIDDNNPFPLANWLKSEFPEIDDACAIRTIHIGEGIVCLLADASFTNIFNVNIPTNFFVEGRTDRPVAVTDELYGLSNLIKEEHNFDVQTTIPHWSVNTNIPFNMIAPVSLFDEDLENWNFYGMYHIYVLINKNADIETLKQKLDIVELPEFPNAVSIILTPITKLRYNNPSGNMDSEIKFSHIKIFFTASLLVILCSLINYLTLYVSRLRMRMREISLRAVNGASKIQIALTFYVELLLIILLSVFLGLMLICLLFPLFMEYTSIQSFSFSIHAELFKRLSSLTVFGLFSGGIPIFYFINQALKSSGNETSSSLSHSQFRRGSLLLQLFVSLFLLFCSIVFFKQIRFLSHSDLGINRKNVAAVQAHCCPLSSPHYAELIKQAPGVIDALPINAGNYFLQRMSFGSSMHTYEKDEREITYTMFGIFADAHFFDFFGIEIIEGRTHNNEFDGKRVVNETAIKEVGDVLRNSDDVVGVVRDFYISPTTKAKPTRITFPRSGYNNFRAVAYRYEEGMRLQTQENVKRWFRSTFPDQGEFEIEFAYMEDIFEEYFKSERALLTLLSIMALACILIAVFGVYSLTSLTCQQRRKEIAIRKVHGAEVVDIMNIFFKEYLILLALAALVAFPAGYLIMKRWLEGYVKQTSMDAWLFVLIFLIVFVVIVFSIFSTVWRAANHNPAEVVKSE